MKKLKLIYVLIILLIPISSIGVQSCNAPGIINPQILQITYANYGDLDNDAKKDDIITKFVIRSPNGGLVYVINLIDLSIQLPSGKHLITSFYVWAIYVELKITVHWYNCATEKGWYTFNVYLDTMGYYMATGNELSSITTASCTFDPPNQGPPGGMPSAKIFLS